MLSSALFDYSGTPHARYEHTHDGLVPDGSNVGDVPQWDGSQWTPAPAPSNGLAAYVHTQDTPSATWTIAHNMNRTPGVTIIDSANSVVIGDVEYLDSNTLRVTFSGAFSGKAYLV
jgi:hypothetical protein